MPVRIQRKRTAGFNLQAASSNPNGVIYVGRPTRYGNPYYFLGEQYNGLSLALYDETAQGFWTPSLVDKLPDELVSKIYAAHQAWTRRFQVHPLKQIKAELSRYDLACWCPLTSPCHADILLRLANK